MLTKDQIISALAAKTDLSKKEVLSVVNALIGLITEELADGEKFHLTGLGIFEVKQTAARKGRNPNTGQAMDIPSAKKVRFKAAKQLKDAIEA